jgi:hypothetical protein
MNFPAQIYVDAYGQVFGASATDQAYTPASTRTVNGRPVAYAGCWYGSQMSYRPFREAVKAAQAMIVG